MKKTLVLLLALAMVVALFAAFPFASSAAGSTWSGKANIKWYVDNPTAKEFHLKTAEDLAGLAYLVAAGTGKKDVEQADGSTKTVEAPTCYSGVYYDVATGNVLGFELSGEDAENCFDFDAIGFAYPTTSRFNAKNGEYDQQWDAEYENVIDGSDVVEGSNFLYVSIYLDEDLVLNTGSASSWKNSKPANVWMPIGGGRPTGSIWSGFNGNFYGQGHTISGAYFNYSDARDDKETLMVGLFGHVGPWGTIRIQDLILENSYFRGDNTVGTLVARTNAFVELFNCHVRNCYVEATSNNVGGLVGAVHSGPLDIDQCGITNISVETTRAAGAFVGSVNFQDLSINNSFATGTVASRTYTVKDSSGSEITKGGWDAGIIVGRVAQTAITVSNTFANVKVIQQATEGDKAYSASCGAIYGAIGKNGADGSYYKTPTLEISQYYYVDNFEAKGEVLAFDKAIPVTADQLTGKAPKVQKLKNFDWDEVWDVVTGDIPMLRNAGKATSSGSDDGPDAPGEHTHVINDDTFVKEKPATCTQSGVKAHYACPCGENLDAEGNVLSAADLEIPKLGHTYGEWIEEVAATKSTDGTKGHYHCATCGKNFDANHNPIADITIPATGNGNGGGCGGVIVGVPFIGIVVLGAALLVRKKEEENK